MQVNPITMGFRTASRSENIELGPPARFMLDASEITLRTAGLPALRELLQQGRREQIYAIDVQGRDLLGRPVDPAIVEHARELHVQSSYTRAIRLLKAPDGSEWLVFAERRQPPPQTGDMRPPHGGHPPPGVAPPAYGHRPPPPPRDGGPHFPLIQMSFAMLGSLVSASILAWYFAKPIRHLRSAFEAAASGKLDTRIGPEIDSRRDDLADLAHDFDRMAAQLQSLMEGQRRLLHDVSHELRSPLARLQAAIGLARQLPEKSGTWLERIERESVRIDKMIGALLTLSRLETGMTENAAGGGLLVSIVLPVVDANSGEDVKA